MKSPVINDGNDQASEISDVPADFERAISLTGHGKFNYLLLLAIVPTSWAAVYSSSSMSYILPSTECDLQFTDLEKGMLTSMPSAGMVIMSLVWGFIIDAFGRRKIIVYGSLCFAINTLASTFSQTSWQLIIFKFIDGVVMSGPYAALQSYLAEVHSEHNRSRIYMCVGMVIAVGNISLPCLAWLVIPRKWPLSDWVEITSWRLFLGFTSLPGLAAGFAFYFFPESPRFLLATRRHDSALEVYKQIYSLNTGKHPDTYPVASLEEEDTIKIQGVTFKETLKGCCKQIQPIFMPPNVVNLVLTSAIQCGATLGSNTLRLWMPMVFAVLETYEQAHLGGPSTTICYKIGNAGFVNGTASEVVHCSNVVNDTVYTNSIVISVATVIGYIIARSLVNAIGKRILMGICFFGAGCCCGALYWARNSNEILAIASVFVALTSIGGTIVNNFVVDVFPTTLRAMALSGTTIIGRMGAFVGNLVFPILFSLDCLAPFIMIGSACLMCALLVLVLPRKTKG
ncbi:putative transporter svop-1 isoform X2 [Copidosoma floridanum]|uniref:putative transporter svop-1 isoform X2 n=1 Tax=Copidosoma floridanum TaxID=29053 RepID=UPI0006C9DF1D|nr:putative transporter svop-1 isoform X2 [Copidosoma floridanum]